MQVIYLETAIRSHPRVLAILERFSQRCQVIEVDHYREVFNPKSQNFRLQKQNPALILAQKPAKRVHPTPEGFGIGDVNNYYFSHLLNCPYDCRYCFLQGLYRSANFVLFVNYEDFMAEITATIQAQPEERLCFFSGYDADSLAYEPVTGFLESFMPFFAKHASALFELRTKSANINALLKHAPVNNVIAAFSFTPQEISQQVEHKVPSVKKRIEAMQRLAAAGWRIGLRFDPLIYASNFAEMYSALIQEIFAGLDVNVIHSVSVGPLRFPTKMYQKLVNLYPEDKLLAHPLQRRGNQVSYSAEDEKQMKQTVLFELEQHVPNTLIFECQPI